MPQRMMGHFCLFEVREREREREKKEKSEEQKMIMR